MNEEWRELSGGDLDMGRNSEQEDEEWGDLQSGD